MYAHARAVMSTVPVRASLRARGVDRLLVPVPGCARTRGDRVHMRSDDRAQIDTDTDAQFVIARDCAMSCAYAHEDDQDRMRIDMRSER